MSLESVRTRGAVIATALLLTTGCIRATAQAPVQTGSPGPALADSLARAFLAEHDPAGLVVALVTPAGDHILPYGAVSLEDGAPPVGATTRFEIGSVTKVFTTTLLAEMVARGELELDQPVSGLLPPHARGAGDDQSSYITLRQLASHTSGLPRMPGNMAPAHMGDPYADYSAERLHAWLAETGAIHDPDAGYLYSNLGAGLLGHVLGLRAGTSFDELLSARVLEPLGLDGTYVAAPGSPDDPEMATGHAGTAAVPFWEFDVLAGAGGLRSSAVDLLRFVRAHLDPPNRSLGEAVRMTREHRHPIARSVSVALGWHVTVLDGVEAFWHNGATGGFRSFVAFVPDRMTGVVVLTNSAVPIPAVDQLALRILSAAIASQ